MFKGNQFWQTGISILTIILFNILGVSVETRLERYFCRPFREYVAKEHKRIH